jgi:hypothetical protein
MQELNWNNDNEQNLEFPVHYWNYIEKMFSQFGTGEHIVTKAYETDNDYLGFTDDYDFCWGAVNEGEGLPVQQYPDDWEIDDNSQIEYTQKDYGFTEYTQETGRLWGVYVESIGKIFLLRANEELTDWDRNELLTFAPSGSQKPSIEFNKNGNYEIAVEIKPAGTEIREIWLLSPPYADEGIRQICDGRTPHLTLNHDKELVLFYTNQEQTRIFYRLAAESFNTEHEVGGIFEPERQLNLVQSFKVFEKYETPAPYDVFKSESYGYKGKLIVFYKRDDDYKPYKYALTETLFDYEFLYKEPVFNYGPYKENTALDINLGIEWLNVVAAKLKPVDTTNLDISLGIEWLEIEPFILEPVENTELDISLGIEWLEITTLTENKTENTNFSIGIDSILWLEV